MISVIELQTTYESAQSAKCQAQDDDEAKRTQINSPLGTQMCGMPLISIILDLDMTRGQDQSKKGGASGGEYTYARSGPV